jgi:hypothetical protein
MRSIAAALPLCAMTRMITQIAALRMAQHRPRLHFSTLQTSITALDTEQLETAASAALQDWFATHGRVAVLTGAGISTDSGM